jgi:FixJ family two-component response regulator
MINTQRSDSFPKAGGLKVVAGPAEPSLAKGAKAQVPMRWIRREQQQLSNMPMIYIVDDDEAVTKALKRLLRSWGMRVRTFASGADFLTALESSENADCSVIDIRMPRMTGLDIQQHMISAGMNVPIIFITAHEAEGIEEQALRGGAIGFLKKPFTDEALVALIYKAVEGRPKTTAPDAGA